MKKLKEQESIGSRLKSEIKTQYAKLGEPPSSEAMLAIADSANKVSTNENQKKTKMIRKPLKKGVSKNLVGNTKMKTPISKLYSIGKSESKEATGASGAGQYSQPLFSETKKEMQEKWSEKYKRSIDCNNPKGFSQKAHCQGKKKKIKESEVLKGGKADKKTVEDLINKYKRIKDAEQKIRAKLKKGTEVEMEHTDNKTIAKEIAMDHLYEDPNYYEKLDKIEGKKTETKEATGASSAGSYVTPAAWAKSTSTKHWRNAKANYMPGAKRVRVKKKCKKFPYCNQGDINALDIFENEQVKKVINKISDKHNISEELIKSVLKLEIKKNQNK